MPRFDATYVPVYVNHIYIFLSAGIQIMKRITSYFKPFTPDEEENYELKQTQSSRHFMAVFYAPINFLIYGSRGKLK